MSPTTGRGREPVAMTGKADSEPAKTCPICGKPSVAAPSPSARDAAPISTSGAGSRGSTPSRSRKTRRPKRARRAGTSGTRTIERRARSILPFHQENPATVPSPSPFTSVRNVEPSLPRFSTLTRFALLYAALYSAFGVASPFLPAFLGSRASMPRRSPLLLASGTAIRLDRRAARGPPRGSAPRLEPAARRLRGRRGRMRPPVSAGARVLDAAARRAGASVAARRRSRRFRTRSRSQPRRAPRRNPSARDLSNMAGCAARVGGLRRRLASRRAKPRAHSGLW